MYDWLIEYRCGQWCVVETYTPQNDMDGNYFERILFQSFSKYDAIDWRSANTAYYF